MKHAADLAAYCQSARRIWPTSSWCEGRSSARSHATLRRAAGIASALGLPKKKPMDLVQHVFPKL